MAATDDGKSNAAQTLGRGGPGCASAGGVDQLGQRLPLGLERCAAGVRPRREARAFMPDQIRDNLLGDRLVLQ